jgi:uncharacterized protein DUF4158
VEYVAGLVKVDPALFTKYSWSARAIKYHRAQIRDSFGFREATRADEQLLAAWLAREVCGVELVEDRLVEALLAHCRAERIEPPGRVERIVASARAQFDAWLCSRTVDRLGPAQTSLARLVEGQDDAHSPGAGLSRRRGCGGGGCPIGWGVRGSHAPRAECADGQDCPGGEDEDGEQGSGLGQERRHLGTYGVWFEGIDTLETQASIRRR